MLYDLVIRAAEEKDLNALVEISKELGPGFTSLPNDKSILKQRLHNSMESFSAKLEKNARTYLFVMENTKTQKIVGTCSIQTSVAYPWPFYNYKLSTIGQYSQVLNRHNENQILHLVSDYQGSAELGGLFLDPDYRGEGRGAFLSRSRCLFISQFPELFPDVLIAEMRGICDVQGNSPFWEAVGKPFFGMDFKEADFLRATTGNLFISELMPKYAVYVALLPDSAKQVIGRAHEKSMPAMHVLKKEGFQFRNYVDILNAGPTIEIYKKDLKTTHDSQVMTVTMLQKKLESKEVLIIGNCKLNFRAVLGVVEIVGTNEVAIEEDTAKHLQVKVGDNIRFCYGR